MLNISSKQKALKNKIHEIAIQSTDIRSQSKNTVAIGETTKI